MDTKTARPGDLMKLPVEGAKEAPILYFDEVPAIGITPGVGRVTLVAHVHDVGANGEVTMRRVAIAHLRANAGAFSALRHGIEQIEVAAAPPQQSAMRR